MNKQKFDLVINSFEEVGIRIPTEVKNSIEDVFLENDDIDNVNCWDINEVREFEDAMTIVNKSDININGSSIGSTTQVWTYYGNVEFSLSEFVNLVDDEGNTLSEVVHFEADMGTVTDPKSWAIILMEHLDWDTTRTNGKIEKVLNLNIYCPESLDSIPEENEEVHDKFDAIYGTESEDENDR